MSNLSVKPNAPLATRKALEDSKAPKTRVVTASPDIATKNNEAQQIDKKVPQKAAAPSPQSNVSNLPPVATISAAHTSPLPVQPFSFPSSLSTSMQIDPTLSNTFAFANVKDATHALFNNSGPNCIPSISENQA